MRVREGRCASLSKMTPTGDQRREGGCKGVTPQRNESVDWGPSLLNQPGPRRAALAVMGHRIEIPPDNDGGRPSLSVRCAAHNAVACRRRQRGCRCCALGHEVSTRVARLSLESPRRRACIDCSGNVQPDAYQSPVAPASPDSTKRVCFISAAGSFRSAIDM